MTTESFGDTVELRTSSIRDPTDDDSVRVSETYCHAVQLNFSDQALPDVVSRNNGCDEKTEDHYDTIGSVGTLPRTKDHNRMVPNDKLSSSGDVKGFTVPPPAGSDSDMASSESMPPYATWNEVFPTNQRPPSGLTPPWCTFKRAMKIGIVLLIIFLVSCLTLTTTLLLTKAGQTGASPVTPPPSTKAASTAVSTSTPTTTPPTSTIPSSTSTTSPSTTSTSVSPSTTNTSVSPSTTSTSVSPSTTSTSVSPTTTTTSLSPSTTSTTTTTTTSVSSTTTSSSIPPSTSLSSTTSTTTVTTLSTNTTCSSSRKCHSCNSRYERCPVNGTMAGTDLGQVMPCPCGTACFSDVNHLDGNIVHRGCTEQYPAWDTASSKNLSCREINQHFLCFCQGDRCNTDDMTPYIP